MARSILIYFISLIALMGWLETGYAADAESQAKQLADSMKSTVSNPIAEEDLQEQVPHYTEDPEQKDLYGDGVSEIESQGLIESNSNEASVFAKESSETRPEFTIDRNNDPLMKNMDVITDKSGSLTDSYSGCEALPVGTEMKTVVENDSCLVNGFTTFSTHECERELETYCANSDAGRKVGVGRIFNYSHHNKNGEKYFTRHGGSWHYFGKTTNNLGGNCSRHMRTISFNISDLSDIDQFRLKQIKVDDWVKVTVNGHKVAQKPNNGNSFGVWDYGFQRYIRYNEYPHEFRACELGRVRTYSMNKNLKPYLREGRNYIRFEVRVSGGGNIRVALKATKKVKCQVRDRYSRSCDGGFSAGGHTPTSSTCIEPGGFKYIKGTRVHRPCWKWRETYKVESPPQYSEEPKCDELRSQGCYQTGDECITNHADGYCETRRLDFNCEEEVPARTVDLCGETMVCPDGECTEEYQESEDATEDFKKAMTTIALADEIAQEYDEDTLEVFKGTGKTCFEGDWLSAKHCCKEGGLALDWGVTQCSTEEKELSIARDAKRTHHVGGYEKKDESLGVTTNVREYETFCEYPSKLGRIFIEAANDQFGRDYGTPESPVCSGITLEELETLDLEDVDLSEFFDDAMDSATPGSVPDTGAMADQLRDKYETITEE